MFKTMDCQIRLPESECQFVLLVAVGPSELLTLYLSILNYKIEYVNNRNGLTELLHGLNILIYVKIKV